MQCVGKDHIFRLFGSNKKVDCWEKVRDEKADNGKKNRWKYVLSRTKKQGLGRLPVGQSEEDRKERERGRRCRRLLGSAAVRLIAVDLHDKRFRQLVTKVALRH